MALAGLALAGLALAGWEPSESLATGVGLAALDIAEVAQHAHPAIGVLDQELVAPVLEGKDPAAGFNNERRCTGVFIDGGARLGDGEPECLVDGLGLSLLGPAGRIDGGPDRFLRAHLRIDSGGSTGTGARRHVRCACLFGIRGCC